MTHHVLIIDDTEINLILFAALVKKLEDCEPPTFTDARSGLNWALDCANGSASKIAPEVFRDMGAAIRALHNAPDGKNINADCGALHPRSLHCSHTYS